MSINATLLGQMLSFAVFIWITMKYIWPPLLEAMQEREKKIAEGLNAASKAEEDLQAAQLQVEEEINAAKTKAADIIDQAKKRAEQMVEEAKDQARDEGDRIKTAAQAEIEQEVNRAKEELRGSLAVLAVSGAEKILESTVDQAAHSEMLNKLAAEL